MRYEWSYLFSFSRSVLDRSLVDVSPGFVARARHDTTVVFLLESIAVVVQRTRKFGDGAKGMRVCAFCTERWVRDG